MSHVVIERDDRAAALVELVQLASEALERSPESDVKSWLRDHFTSSLGASDQEATEIAAMLVQAADNRADVRLDAALDRALDAEHKYQAGLLREDVAAFLLAYDTRMGRLREHIEFVFELHVYPEAWTDHERAVSVASLPEWLADADPHFTGLTYTQTHDVIARVLAEHNGTDAVLQREVVDVTLAKLLAASKSNPRVEPAANATPT